jgi:hypothetical protein
MFRAHNSPWCFRGLCAKKFNRAACTTTRILARGRDHFGTQFGTHGTCYIEHRLRVRAQSPPFVYIFTVSSEPKSTAAAATRPRACAAAFHYPRPYHYHQSNIILYMSDLRACRRSRLRTLNKTSVVSNATPSYIGAKNASSLKRRCLVRLPQRIALVVGAFPCEKGFLWAHSPY